MIREILEQFKNIVAEIEFLNIKEIKGFIHNKCKIQLIDGSNLRISEKWDEQQLIQYSYYWLDEKNELIIGWDNAPHHQKIFSYPHHSHIRHQTNVHVSTENCLKDILDFIEQKILN